jgi:hypothetical protein
MAESNPLSDQNTTPEDVATLYSWANLHGAKYRDFSASRAQTREMARLRAEQAAHEGERQRHEGAAFTQGGSTEIETETVAVTANEIANEIASEDQPAAESQLQDEAQGHETHSQETQTQQEMQSQETQDRMARDRERQELPAA